MAIVNNAQTTGAGFNIGIDFGFYGLTPTSNNEDVLAGYKHATTANKHTKRSTMTIRKWLNLRLHAYERGIHFSDSIQPKFLDELMARTKGRCPYTGIKLTKGALKGSDWSIDRILNEHGYIPINIVIMATDINKAKSDLTSDEIESIINEGNTFKSFPVKVWALILDDMFLTKTMLYEPSEIDSNLLEKLRSGESILTHFLQSIIGTSNIEHKKMYTKGLLEFAYHDSNLEKRIRRLVRSVVIKAGVTKSDDILRMVGRSGKLKREIQSIGEAINVDRLKTRFTTNKKIMHAMANEAVSTSKHKLN